MDMLSVDPNETEPTIQPRRERACLYHLGLGGERQAGSFAGNGIITAH